MIDLKAKQGIAFDKSKIECFNCQRTGHFARECKFAKYQANRNSDNTRGVRRDVPNTESQPKALVAQEEVPEIDWGAEFDDEPVTYSMVAIEEVDWSMDFDEEPGFAALESREEFGSFD